MMKVQYIPILVIMAVLLMTIIPTTIADSTIEVINLSHDTYNLTYQQITEMPQTTLYAELYCYGSLVASGDWTGVQLSYILTQANVSSEVKSIQFTASDSYMVTIPIQLAMTQETIIAYQKDGDPVTGLRLVLPGVNGASWIAQIVSITMGDNEVDSPAAASGSGGRADLITNLLENTQALPTPTMTPKQTQSTSQPIPDNSTTNQIVPPANDSKPTQTLQPQTENGQSISLDNSSIVLIAAVFVTGSAIAAIFAYKNKMKIKDTTQNK